jgi:hypothetical protein
VHAIREFNIAFDKVTKGMTWGGMCEVIGGGAEAMASPLRMARARHLYTRGYG